MCRTITVTNLKSHADSVFRFRTDGECEHFREEMERQVYGSKNKHIRYETPPPCQPAIIEQYVIYTSTTDLERVIVRNCQ